MKAKAQGKLRHQFHGTYAAIIALGFNSEYEAQESLSKLGKGWFIGKNPKALVWCGNSEALEECKSVLGSFGADVKKIDSIASSIDYGEDFEIVVDIVAEEQTHMFV